MKTKILILCVVLVGLCGSTALALDPMGPPTAELEVGKWAIGTEFMYSDMDLNLGEGVVDLQVTKFYGTFGYGLMDNVEIFGRIGIGNAEGDVITSESDDLEYGSSEFIFGGGARVTLFENDTCHWGLVGTFSSFKSEEHGDRDEVEFDEYQIAFGPTVKITDSISMFGGPFFHSVDGSAEDRSDSDPSTSLDEDGFGGYLGAILKINENASFRPEFQWTDDAVGFGFALIWTF